MGAWGSESCSNDYTWDYLYAKNIHNMTQKECNESLKEVWNSKVTYEEGRLKLGVVVWILCQANKVPIDKLEETLVIAKTLVTPKELGKSGYVDEDERKRCLENEIVLIEFALENGGRGKNIPIEGLMDKIDRFLEEKK